MMWEDDLGDTGPGVAAIARPPVNTRFLVAFTDNTGRVTVPGTIHYWTTVTFTA